MNVNVIKQFSVYLKLQTFTLHASREGWLVGCLASPKITFFLVVSQLTLNERQCQENCFSFGGFLSFSSFSTALRSCCFKVLYVHVCISHFSLLLCCLKFYMSVVACRLQTLLRDKKENFKLSLSLSPPEEQKESNQKENGREKKVIA